jgi:hypothetical protein
VEQDELKFEELHSTSGSKAVVCMDFLAQSPPYTFGVGKNAAFLS